MGWFVWHPTVVRSALASMLVACGDPNAQPDAMVDTQLPPDLAIDAPDPDMPLTLADTGLCVDAGCTQIASGIHAYTPRFELWSDTASKRRWIQLPAGMQIDTTDMDHWQFPVGTKLWKEFTRDGVRVETRLVMRIGAGTTTNDWFYAAYVWNAAQDVTTWAEFGEPDANGTDHDVPGKLQCWECHENTKPSRVLGFSALQLDFDGATGELDLGDVIAANMLSAPPTAPSFGAYFPLPGNAPEQAALGYMHANCGHCHNPSSNAINNTPLQLWLPPSTLGSLAATPAYTTAVGVEGAPLAGRTKIVDSGAPDQSILIYRFESSNVAERMPAVGTELLDTAAQALLRDWITNIQ
jgi:hypothetical protein